MLEKCSDPLCPKCGCQESVRMRRRLADFPVRQCQHCGHKFPVGLASLPKTERPMVAIYQKTPCAYCYSTDTAVRRGPVSTDPDRRRYHTCNTCGEIFPSVEI